MDVKEMSISGWDELACFLPEGWYEKLQELGLLKFGRKFAGIDGASALLRVLLIHLAGNVSLRTACAMASQAGICDVSDVALLKRLKKADGWFTWATQMLMAQVDLPADSRLPCEYRWRFVDGTVVEEPGATGSTWRLHYSLDASTFSPDEIHVSDVKVGEKLSNFSVQPGDVFIADRAYCTRNGIAHVHDRGGYVMTRLAPGNLPLHDEAGRPFALLRHLRHLSYGQVGDYAVCLHRGEQVVRGRVCAIRIGDEEAKRARARIRRRAQKNSYKSIRTNTLEYAGYVLVFTTLPADADAEKVMAVYRYRWQIELLFKRLKSLIGAAPLHKRSPDGMRGWLCGKVFVAVLNHAMLRTAEALSPWGYPLRSDFRRSG